MPGSKTVSVARAVEMDFREVVMVAGQEPRTKTVRP